MKKNDSVMRILQSKDDKVFVIDCIKRTMPVWIGKNELNGYEEVPEEEIAELTGIVIVSLDELDPEGAATAQKRFTIISPILPIVANEKKRSEMIRYISELMNICKQSIRQYLCLYLVYQDKAALAPKKTVKRSSCSCAEIGK